MKRFFLEKKFYLLIFLPIFMTYIPEAFWIQAHIVEVLDGDTVEIRRLSNKKKERVRLVYIDAPEISQGEWGVKSYKTLKKLAMGQKLKIRIVGRGYYGRLLGEIFFQGKSLNLELLKKGEAFLYPWSHFLSLEQKAFYIKTEAEAKKNKRGFWREGLLQPWKFRRRHKK